MTTATGLQANRAYNAYMSGGTSGVLKYPDAVGAAITKGLTDSIGQACLAVKAKAASEFALGNIDAAALAAANSATSASPTFTHISFVQAVKTHIDNIYNATIGLPGGTFFTTVSAVAGVSETAASMYVPNLTFDDHLGSINGLIDNDFTLCVDNTFYLLATPGLFDSASSALANLLSALNGNIGPYIDESDAVTQYSLILTAAAAAIDASTAVVNGATALANTAAAVITAISAKRTTITAQLAKETTNINNLTTNNLNLNGILGMQGIASQANKPAAGMLKNISVGAFKSMVDNAPTATKLLSGFDFTTEQDYQRAVDQIQTQLGQPTPTPTNYDLVLKASKYEPSVLNNANISTTAGLNAALQAAIKVYNIPTTGRSTDRQILELRAAVDKRERAAIDAIVRAQLA